MTEKDQETMTATEVAEFLGISRPSLQRLIKNKELTPINKPNPVLTRARVLYFNKAEVVAFMERKKAKGN